MDIVRLQKYDRTLVPAYWFFTGPAPYSKWLYYPLDWGRLVQRRKSFHSDRRFRDPVNTGVQVRVYKLDEFEQHELLTTGITSTLKGTENTVEIPLRLDPGRYKIYVYLTTNGQREAAVIRDITV